MDLHVRQLLLCLVAAHVLGDFLLQTKRDAEEKGKLSVLVKHTLIIAGLSYLLAGAWTTWQIPAWVFGTHALIDWIKARVGKGWRAFLVDQFAHILVLIALAQVFGGAWRILYWEDVFGVHYLHALILLTGFVAAVYAVGYLIGVAVQPYLEELAAAGSSPAHEIPREKRGFANGGQVIGRLERALIFLFILMGVPAGVGFLIAAKSIFRFGELREHEHRMEAEYILIGTLMSFGGGLVVAVATHWALGLVWS